MPDIWGLFSEFYADQGLLPFPASMLPRERVAEAEAAKRSALQRLGVHAELIREGWPRIQFFKRTTSARPGRGFFWGELPHVVFIDANLSGSALAEVVAHESKHAADHWAGRESTEAAAVAFGNTFADEMASAPSPSAILISRRPERVRPPYTIRG